jgi:hypothetical protein
MRAVVFHGSIAPPGLDAKSAAAQSSARLPIGITAFEVRLDGDRAVSHVPRPIFELRRQQELRSPIVRLDSYRDYSRFEQRNEYLPVT